MTSSKVLIWGPEMIQLPHFERYMNYPWISEKVNFAQTLEKRNKPI